MNLGESHFVDKIEALPDEKIIWEGGASHKGVIIYCLNTIFGFGSIIFFPILLLGLFFLLITLLPQEPKANDKNVLSNKSNTEIVASDSVKAENRINVPHKESKTVQWVYILIGFISAGLISLIININYKIRDSWYIITSERICIQTGGINKTIISIDLDKIISIKSTHSYLERLFKLHSIEIVHSGKEFNGTKLSFLNPYTIHYVPLDNNVTSRLLNNWLPRDNK